MEDQTYSEIVAAAEYSEQRMHFNNDLHGRPENPLDEQEPVYNTVPQEIEQSK